ncbi:MAG: hypothetical protein NC084_05000 [Bacteroides sp.]|nr:hypothetical protein [Eubacterium sp.]MCM1418458.1 hypothetical protein [Roseburia sp.]MCM1462054.1 hypothetical protein [Bacteroides sp.]
MPRINFSDGTTVRLSCPTCGRVQRECAVTEYRYGSPLKTCRNKKCGARYLDPYIHELAAEPPAPDAFSVKSKLIGFGLMVLFFAISGGFLWLELNYDNGYHMALPFIMVASAVGAVAFLVEIVLIKAGFKERRTARLRRESEERLNNPVYARELKKLGYPVPAEYLGEEATEADKTAPPDFIF